MQKARKPIDIKIGTVVAISAILHETDPVALEQALKNMTGGVSDFFEDEFAVLDIGALDGEQAATLDWPVLVALFKRFRLNTVAVRHAPEALHAGIVAHGLAIDNPAAASVANARTQEAAVQAAVEQAQPELQLEPQAAAVEVAPVAEPVPAPAAMPRTMIVDTPVRAGQRIYARGADLVIMAAVNNGAEIIADGCIHVYAPLRGRALAGASGNTEARIFAASLEAELVSIAGVYRTFEHGHPAEIAGKQVQVRLSGERIDVLAMKAS